MLLVRCQTMTAALCKVTPVAIKSHLSATDPGWASTWVLEEQRRSAGWRSARCPRSSRRGQHIRREHKSHLHPTHHQGSCMSESKNCSSCRSHITRLTMKQVEEPHSQSSLWFFYNYRPISDQEIYQTCRLVVAWFRTPLWFWPN